MFKIPFIQIMRTPPEGLQDVRILINRRTKMTTGKTAAQAVHAALLAYGIPHGRVVVLDGTPNQINVMQVQVKDAGATEVKPGTLTAGATLEATNRP